MPNDLNDLNLGRATDVQPVPVAAFLPQAFDADPVRTKARPPSRDANCKTENARTKVCANDISQLGVNEQSPIIVHCHLRWDFVWQRPQQIFSRLARTHRILFIEEPMWFEEGGAPHLFITEPYPNVVRVVAMLDRALAGNVDAQCDAMLPLLHDALREHPLLAGQFEAPVQWFYSPMTAPKLLGKFDHVGLVYDCMDELANFRFAPPDIADRERFVMSQADVVFTGGYQLYEAKSRHHHNVHFYGCGVDVDHYGKARLPETELPKEVKDLPGPRFGYFGVIDERLDYELIERLAGAYPEASVVMVGPFAKVDPESLPKLPNIHWLGQKSYEELPALVKSFDVCLMPFALNEATRYINPTKTLEYMAAGKPIVSTAVPDVVRNFTPIVEVAHSIDAFLAAAGRLAEEVEIARIEEGLARAHAATWEAIVGSLHGDILRTAEAPPA